MYPGVLTIDGSRIKFSVKDWKAMLAIKALSTRMREILSRYFRNPQVELSPRQQGWIDVWQRIFTQVRSLKEEKQIKHTRTTMG